MPSADPIPMEAPVFSDAQLQHPVLQHSESEPQAQPQAQAQPQLGPKATAFTILYEKTLSKTLSTISYESFAACFPTIAANAPESLRHVHGQMIERLGTLAKADFEDVMRERNVIENLNALDALIADAKRRKARAVEGEAPPPAPHDLPISAIVAAHLAPQLAAQQSQMNAKLQTIQSQNAALFELVQRQQREIEELVKGVETAVGDLEGANGALAGEMEGLTGVLRDAEGDVDVLMS